MDQKDNIKDSSELTSISDRYSYIAAKNQKLASALYLVTNFLSEAEPIKWKLRQRALDLAGEFTSGRTAAVFYKLSLLERATKFCDEIIGLLDIARSLGVVSEMNLSVLKNEYEELKGQLEDLAGGRQLERYLLIPETAKPRLEISRDEVITHTGAPKVEREKSIAPAPTAPSAAPKRPAQSVIREDSASKNGRKQAIISFLAEKDWTSIKDIAAAVPDCSQKTVQRELSDLVEQGVLKKRGDRRWSRYVLVK